ncbi:hypothetical protein M422DRAFT_243710 [Sphaerobolus stellatus SS14]|nr:hypothetical protein M422DRAFT_243710 [Sphaerobolus stellatus SS14]
MPRNKGLPHKALSKRKQRNHIPIPPPPYLPCPPAAFPSAVPRIAPFPGPKLQSSLPSPYYAKAAAASEKRSVPRRDKSISILCIGRVVGVEMEERGGIMRRGIEERNARVVGVADAGDIQRDYDVAMSEYVHVSYHIHQITHYPSNKAYQISVLLA